MVRMILNLMTLEEDLKNIHLYMDHLARNISGFDNDPAATNLRDRLKIMEIHLNEAISEWPQLGLAPTL